MKENSIEEDMKRIEYIFEFQNKMSCQYVLETEDGKALEHILSDYKRVLKENEELLEVKVSASAHNRILELEKENEELIDRMKKFLLKENKMCDFLESEE